MILLAVTFIIIFVNIILGLIVFLGNRKNTSNIIFFLLTWAFSLLSIVNHISLLSNDSKSILFWARLVMALAAIHTFLFVILARSFPDNKIKYDNFIKIIAASFVGIIFLSFSSLIFERIDLINNRVITIPGKLIALYGAWAIFCIICAIYLLYKKYKNELIDGLKKSQLRFVLIGSLTTYSLLIVMNFIVVNVFQYVAIVKLTAIFSLPFIVLTAYAILKHGLFNAKVIATELLVFAIWIVVLIQLLMANSLNERLLGGGLLLCVIIFGIFLIRSVKHEVRQREELEELSHELQHANEELKQLDKAKSEFVSIASHQLRTPLSITKGYVSMILEGIYGDPSNKIKEILQKVYVTNEGLIALVNNLLDLSRMEAGTLKYEFTKVSFEKMVDEIVIELELEAKHRDLYLTWTSPEEPFPLINADSVKFKQVIEILIENSLKYTQKGGVSVSLERENSSLLLKIKDTGIGIDPHEIEHLFNKFGRGEEGSKVNAGGIGLGLYTAKQIILAHGGEIWVESKGRGKGSTFCVRLPV